MAIKFKGKRMNRLGRLIVIPHGRVARRASLDPAKKEVKPPRTVFERR